MLNSDENRKKVIGRFPKLLRDKDFKIVKKDSPDYNCFAWAANHEDVFWTPLPFGIDKGPITALDGVSYDWPFGVTNDSKLSTMISIFSTLGYVECVDGSLEAGFRKIAFYGTEDEVTHAARQLIAGKDRGKWTSKLGPWFAIQHGDATTIEGNDYGLVIKYLKMAFS
jgi:hypothetical protein